MPYVGNTPIKPETHCYATPTRRKITLSRKLRLVNVPDTAALYRSFAAGMRAEYGKLLVSGIPRVTRPPRKRKNAGVVDPGGNWIRIFP